MSKYYTKEDHLQAKCMQWMLLAYPELAVLHSPNEGKRTVFEQRKMNFIGKKQSKGFPDIMIFNSTKDGYKGLAVELKVIYDSGAKNYPSKDQKKWIEKLNKQGYKALVVWTFEKFQEIIEECYN